MRRRTRLAVLWLAVAAGCRAADTDEAAGEDLLGMDADQVMIGMDHFVTREGLLRARLQADTAFTFEDVAEIRLRGVDIKFFDETGQEISALTGRRGIYHTGTRDMEMMEDIVVLDRRESRRLETEELFYDAAEDRLSSDVEFVLYRGTTVVRGAGFVSDPALDTVEITRPSGVSEGMTAPGRGTPATGEAAPVGEAVLEAVRGGTQDTTPVAPADSGTASGAAAAADTSASPEAGAARPPGSDSTAVPDSTPSGGSVR